jgi:stage II sporulation protein AA (anti-sigma F factor antagonist)
MEIATERVDDVVIAKAKGRFYSNDAQAVEAGLVEAIADGTPRLVLDLTEMDYISSAGLRVLLKLAKQIQKAKGKVVLFGLRPNVREVFSISAFDRIFSIHNDRAAAVAAIR